jgi:hypothetical protein
MYDTINIFLVEKKPAPSPVWHCPLLGRAFAFFFVIASGKGWFTLLEIGYEAANPFGLTASLSILCRFFGVSRGYSVAACSVTCSAKRFLPLTFLMRRTM